MRMKSNFRWLVSASLGIAMGIGSAAAAAVAPEGDIRRDSTVAAIEKVLPCVVNIATETVVEYHDFYETLLREFYGSQAVSPRQQRSTSLGSGVIIDEDGYVLTNFHVVHRATRIQIKLWDGREYEAEPKVATEASDVALLKIKARPGEKFKAIKFAADDDLLLGETVLALGNPYGLGGSVTKGILSSKNRRPATGKEPLDVQDWLQTDAAINPGNSGGPLVNLRGELMGLNVAVYHGEQGMGVGFSIPVKQVSAALSHFFAPEVTDGLWFGAHLSGGPGPLTITEVQPDSPAQRAGLRPNDQILEINGAPASGLVAFNRALGKNATKSSHIVVAREKQRKTLSVRMVPFTELIPQKLGMNLVRPDEKAATRLGLQPGQGLVVQSIEPNGPADKGKMQEGYLVTSIDGQDAGEIRIVGEILANKKAGELTKITLVAPRRRGAFVELLQGTVELKTR
jgi:serine protease Do